MAQAELRALERAAPYAAQLNAAGDEPVWLKAMREEAMARFQSEGFPTLRTEAWKYTNLERLTREVFAPVAEPAEVDQDAIAPWCLAGAHLLVFVDGHFVHELSDLGGLPPEGVTMASIHRFLDFDPEFIRPMLGHADTALSALNLALMQDGAVIRVPKGIVLEKPIQLIHVATAAKANTASHVRHTIALGENAVATVMETYLAVGQAWTNAVTEAKLERGAKLRHYMLTEAHARSFLSARFAPTLARDASIEALVVANGAGTARDEIATKLAGEGSEAHVNGIVLGHGQGHFDTWTEIDHASPHTSSRQIFKAVLDDRSRSAFQGRVVVREGAQKVDAHQLNKNLLLSPQARADSKPELEILADDVKCSHGATVGDLDKNAMFYLRSRGIPEAEARALLIEAFVAEILDGISDASVREFMKSRADQWLAAGAQRKAA
jgi:Fe-S cluster assembly protein SufD